MKGERVMGDEDQGLRSKRQKAVNSGAISKS
jgi:hypothetical protein